MILPRAVLLSLLFVLPTLALPSSNPAYGPYAVHETRPTMPSGWSQGAKVPANRLLPFRIGMKQSNLDKVEEMIMSVSDPKSEKYGMHYTAEEIRETFASSQETVDTISEWLVSEGIDPARIKLSYSKTWLELPVTVEEAERLLRTQYHTYEHASGVTQIASSSEYYLPSDIRDHIELIMPTVHLDAKARMRREEMDEQRGLARRGGEAKRVAPQSAGAAQINNILNTGAGPKLYQGGAQTFNNLYQTLENCSQVIVPACIEALYKFVPTLVPSFHNLPLGIVEYSPVYVQFDDLHTFETKYNVRKGYTPNVDLINGATESQTTPGGGVNGYFNKFGEGNLDVQYAVALTTTPVTILQVGPDNGSGSFNTLLEALDSSYCASEGANDFYEGDPATTTCGTFANAAKVLSTSYGYNEADLNIQYENRQCNEYAKLGMAGYSFLFSSGDNGVAGNGDQCIAADGTYNDGTSGRFNPSYPATCPFGVTSVGATEIPVGGSVLGAEVVADSYIISGGGFSNNFALPSYQASAVQGYLKNHPPPYTKAQYNANGSARAFPDVSANGLNYSVTLEGQQYLVGGTSASCPTFASIINILNNARANIGKSTLGFLNPFLYSHSYAFQDITSGSNPGCGTAGFSAAPGWDPATGLGTPNVPILLAAALLA